MSATDRDTWRRRQRAEAQRIGAVVAAAVRERRTLDNSCTADQRPSIREQAIAAGILTPRRPNQ